MAFIFTSKGFKVIVDDDDYEQINRYSWWLNRKGYVISEIRPNGKRRVLLMHRLIMNAPDGVQVDHVNHDKLDNRKVNLRLCNNAENQWNTFARKTSKSGYKCITTHKNTKGDDIWQINLRVNKENIYLGDYCNLNAALNVYNHYSKIYHGEFAVLNDVEYMTLEECKKYKCEKDHSHKSIYHGVYFDKSRDKWMAYYRDSKISRTIGRFYTEVEAAVAYNKFIIENNISRELNIDEYGNIL